MLTTSCEILQFCEKTSIVSKEWWQYLKYNLACWHRPKGGFEHHIWLWSLQHEGWSAELVNIYTFIDTCHAFFFKISSSVYSHCDWQVPPSAIDVVKQTDLEPQGIYWDFHTVQNSTAVCQLTQILSLLENNTCLTAIGMPFWAWMDCVVLTLKTWS